MKNLGNILIRIVNNFVIYYRLVELINKFGLCFIRTKNLKYDDDYGGYLRSNSISGGGYKAIDILILYPKFLKWSLEKEIIIISHEIGHYLSSQVSGSKYTELLVAYNAYYGKFPITFENKAKIFEEELSAWLYGKIVLDKFGFKNWDNFDKHRAWALSTYKDCYEAYEKIA